MKKVKGGLESLLCGKEVKTTKIVYNNRNAKQKEKTSAQVEI